jgi:hypothetical protein
MLDIMQAIRDFLVNQTELIGTHIGEVIPEGNRNDYVWLLRSGEILSDDLSNLIDIDGITIDIECVSNRINACRLLTRNVKWLLRGYGQHSVEFVDDFGMTRTLHGFIVEDHDDSYIPRALENDDQVHVGALNVTVLYGGKCAKVGPGPEGIEED